MRNKTIYLSAILFLVILVSFDSPAFSQRRSARQSGIVSDEDGNPISGAEVKMDRVEAGSKYDHKITKTDEEGRFVVSGIRGGDWNVTVTAAGFMPHAQIVNLSSFTRNPELKIRLRKIVAAEVGMTREEAVAVVDEAKALVEQGKYDEAISLYKDYIEKNPEITQVHNLIGEIYEKKEDYKSAVAEYEIVLAENPEETNALFLAGRMYIKLFEYEKAEEYFLRLAELTPEDSDVMYTLGELMLDKGESEGAIEFYTNAVTLRPDFADAHMKLGYAHYAAQNWAEAIKHFEKFIELAPERPEVQFVQPDIEICKQKLEEK